MHEYDIRLFKPDGAMSGNFECVHLSDHAAISAGRKLAAGTPFEVWRDANCICGKDSEASPALLQFPVGGPNERN
jgi:hypothetical protein